MWQIHEHHDIAKISRTLPGNVLRKYELWKDLVFRHGPQILRGFPGFHDEKLKGEWEGWRSSRLNQQYRVIYAVQKEVVAVYVLQVTPHHY